MTKRFTIKEFSTLDAMSSLDVICDNGIELPSSTACDLLNELHEDYQDAITTLFKVKEENKQLKTTIQQLRTDNTKQKKLLNTTMKENEHIKQTIKDMINTERTELGKMVLRQLWRQIQ